MEGSHPRFFRPGRLGSGADSPTVLYRFPRTMSSEKRNAAPGKAPLGRGGAAREKDMAEKRKDAKKRKSPLTAGDFIHRNRFEDPRRGPLFLPVLRFRREVFHGEKGSVADTVPDAAGRRISGPPQKVRPFFFRFRKRY